MKLFIWMLWIRFRFSPDQNNNQLMKHLAEVGFIFFFPHLQETCVLIPVQGWDPGEPTRIPPVHNQSHHRRWSSSGSRTSAWWWSFPSPETWLSQHAPLHRPLQWTQVLLWKVGMNAMNVNEQHVYSVVFFSPLEIYCVTFFFCQQHCLSY